MSDRPMPGMVMDDTEVEKVARERELEQEEGKVINNPVSFTEKIEKVKAEDPGRTASP